MGLFSWLFGGNKKQAEETPQEPRPTSEQKKEAAWAEFAHTPETKSVAAPTPEKETEKLLAILKERYDRPGRNGCVYTNGLLLW